MLDCKIINWMLKGAVQYNQILKEFDKDLIEDIFQYELKPLVKEVITYYSRHKITPNISVLRQLLDKDEFDHNFIDAIEGFSIEENEIGYLIDKMKLRYNNYIMSRLIKNYSSGNYEIQEVNDQVKKLLGSVNRLYKSDVFSEGELSLSTEDRINEYEYTKNNPGSKRGMLSGFRELDDYTWGLKNSEMMVIGGASSSGKSLLMMNMAINSWLGSNSPYSNSEVKNDGKNVLYISLEMSKKQLEQRIDANVANVSHRGLVRGALSPEETDRWKESLKFQKKYGKTFYILDMPRGSSMAEIESKYEIIMGIFKPEAVFIDYLQLMAPSIGQKGTDWIDVGRVSEEMHEFCRKKDVPVITAAQRKAGAGKSSAKYKDNAVLEDLGRSKMIGDNATVVLLIGKREDEDLREDMEVFVVKNRDGPKGKVMLKKSFDKSKIENLPHGWVQDQGDENEI